MLLPATDASCATDVRREARQTASALGLAPDVPERAAIVASELVSNIVKHAGRGHIAVQAFDDAEGRGVELIALDRGPGIADVGRAMQDGYSTAGSAGQGLGAIERLSSVMQIYSRPGLGTAVLARVPGGPGHGRFVASSICEPVADEVRCGDACRVRFGEHAASVLMADGLGHGPGAADAADRAVGAFARLAGVPGAEDAVAAIHAELRPTRGAAVAVAHVDVPAGVVTVSGIGNIVAAMAEGGRVRRMISDNGTAGHVAARVRSFTYPFAAPPLVILHTDGLASRWDLTAYPGLSEAHPALVVGVILRDFRRGRDDADIIAVRWRGP